MVEQYKSAPLMTSGTLETKVRLFLRNYPQGMTGVPLAQLLMDSLAPTTGYFHRYMNVVLSSCDQHLAKACPRDENNAH